MRPARLKWSCFARSVTTPCRADNKLLQYKNTLSFFSLFSLSYHSSTVFTIILIAVIKAISPISASQVQFHSRHNGRILLYDNFNCSCKEIWTAPGIGWNGGPIAGWGHFWSEARLLFRSLPWLWRPLPRLGFQDQQQREAALSLSPFPRSAPNHWHLIKSRGAGPGGGR